MAKREFNQAEVEEILRLAAQNQSSDPERAYSFEELLSIAQEVGIDRASVERIVGRGNGNHPKNVEGIDKLLLGTRVWLREEYVLQGTMDSNQWSDFVQDIEQELKTSGRLEARQTGYVWQGRIRKREIRVSATRRNQITTIDLAMNQSHSLLQGWLLATVVTFVAGVALGNFFGSHQMADKIGYFLAPVIGFLATRTFFAFQENFYMQRMNRLMTRLQDYLMDVPVESPSVDSSLGKRNVEFSFH